jgi:hypothetical protein
MGSNDPRRGRSILPPTERIFFNLFTVFLQNYVPTDWEGYLDRKGKDILWELEETNIPELQKVIETKGIYNK